MNSFKIAASTKDQNTPTPVDEFFAPKVLGLVRGRSEWLQMAQGQARQSRQGAGFMNEKVYLGDGVYVLINDARQLVLTTENGICTTNAIYLELEVWANLIVYVERVIAVDKASRSEGEVG